MRRRRSNPWPAFSDLFSALLLATFAGWMAMAGTEIKVITEEEKREQERSEALAIVGAALKESLGGEIREGGGALGQYESCKPDLCVDTSFNFPLNSDEVSEEQRAQLESVCEKLKAALDKSGEQPLQLHVEGHTDNQPAKASTAAEQFRYNWNLSSRRASSILFALTNCGLSPDTYNIVSIGYADTQPLCTDDTEQCLEKNRRITFRIRALAQSSGASVRGNLKERM